ncbi:E3 ubiquitin-protein ligase hrd-like protein 1 [Ostrea edulis]|uniref:E3 ubiquitin-protein ligase hrd-like protein 1 n=1 Tax=Ostrea edulis TaxID=37623 RepID=UPI0024AEF4C9|nr:E3 ubiquitin-protein ligase hrd-like protein 1 [Ostrea edulis]
MPMEGDFSSFVVRSVVSSTVIMSRHHWTEVGYNSVFWLGVLWSATNLFWLFVYSTCITLTASVVLVIILMIFNKSDSNISEYIFLAFWGIFSYFTNCSIRMPTSEDVAYGSQTFSPEAGSLRYFALTLLVASAKDGGQFGIWIISVTCASVLLNYLCVQIHNTDFEENSNEPNAGTYSRILSLSLLLLIFLTSYLVIASASSFAIIILLAFFRIQLVIKSIEKKFKERYGEFSTRSELFYYFLSAGYICAYVFFVKTSQPPLFSIPIIFLSIETVYYIYLIFENIWVLRRYRENFWKNTFTVPNTKKGNQCPVCLADIWSGRMTSCGHVFHSDCLVRCLRQSSVCPMCRSVVIGNKKCK